VVRSQPSGMVARPLEQSRGKMNDRCGSFYEPSQNPAYRFTLARKFFSDLSYRFTFHRFLKFPDIVTLVPHESGTPDFGAQFCSVTRADSAE